MSLRVIIGLIVILLLILLFFIVSRDESSAAKSRGVVKSNEQLPQTMMSILINHKRAWPMSALTTILIATT